jgi:hypothetical protein
MWWLLPILQFLSHDGEDQPSFLTFSWNHTAALTPDARAVVGDPSFLILITTATGRADSSLATVLLSGPGRITPAESVVGPNAQDIPILNSFRLHPGILLSRLCKRWGVPCGLDPPNANVVFIDAGDEAASDGDVHRGIIALSSILSFRIHTVRDGGLNGSDWWFPLKGGGLYGLVSSNTVPYGTVIVVPGLETAEVANDTEFESARRARGVALTESLRNQSWARRWLQTNESVSVFVEPNAGQGTASHEAFAREIVKSIAERTRESRPIPRDDALELFRTAVDWMEECDHPRGDDIPVQVVFERWGLERVMRLEESILTKYRKMVQDRLSRGDALLMASPEEQASAIANAATDEFQREFDSLHAEIRRGVTSITLKGESEIIRRTLVRQIPGLVVDRRLERIKESRRWM